MKLAPHIAREFTKNAELLEELISEGYVALVEAAKSYQESKGKFPAYAGTAIRNQIKRFLNKQPTNQMSTETVIGAEGMTLLDTLIDPNAIDPEAKLLKRELIQTMKTALTRLDPEDELIIKQYFGLDGIERMTMPQIGKYLGLTKQGVDHRINRSLEFIRNFIRRS
jgi:RNA polymerase sporulation-specific sigma factor